MSTTLIPAHEKKQRLIEAAEAAIVAQEAAFVYAFRLLQEGIVIDIANTPQVPFNLKVITYADTLFSGHFNYAALSSWLQSAGYCLDIVYTDTGRDDIIEELTVDYYEKRDWLNEEKAIRVCDTTGHDYSLY